MKRILVIATYFGTMPPYYRLFFESARRNTSIDFLIYSDCDLSDEEGGNIRVTTLSFEAYKARISKLMNAEFVADHPYKLCDVRPMIGTVHRDDIEGYDFFGWCDLDVIFGDIKEFFTEEMLERFDVLSTRPNATSGHLTLFRNTRKNRKLHKSCRHWRTVMRSPKSFLFDEVEATKALRRTYFDRVNIRLGDRLGNPIARWFTRFKQRNLYMEEHYVTPFSPVPWTDGTTGADHPSTWYYRDGVITNDRDVHRRFIYLHLMFFTRGQTDDGVKIGFWRGRNDYCSAGPEHMTAGIIIDGSGIRPSTD